MENFIIKKIDLKINQWLMAQMGYIGPMIGQHHQFHHYNPGKSKFEKIDILKLQKEYIKILIKDYRLKIICLETIILFLILQHFHG